MRAVGALAVAAVAAGCGGGANLPALQLDAAREGVPGPGIAVLDFVRAATAGDTERMSVLLSEETRASFGPGVEAELAEQLENLAGARVVLSERLDDRWAVGAVAGEDEDGDPAAFAAALVLEGSWRLELGGLAFGRLAPTGEVGSRPEVRVEAQAGDEVEQLLLWIDDRRVAAAAVRRQPFTREIHGRLAEALPLGVHTAVAFASFDGIPGAFAWPFEVTN